MNADGYDDLVVRAILVIETPMVDEYGNVLYNEDTGEILYDREYQGRVFLYLGAPEGLSRLVLQLDETKETFLVPYSPASTVSAGDFNGDGFDDFAVGAWQLGAGRKVPSTSMRAESFNLRLP